MPFATVRITPGIRVEQTPTLLTTSLVASQNIRWRGGLPEKIGGWVQFYASPLTGLVRALWPWADADLTSHLAVAGDGGVQVITGGTAKNISPTILTTLSSTITLTTTMSSNVITITDTGLSTAITLQSAVFFSVQVSIAGVILSGMYAVASVISSDEYTIVASANATSATSAYNTPAYTTVAGSSSVQVAFPNHGLSMGDTWAISAPDVIGGITLSGFYTVATVIDANNFTIIAAVASSSAGPTAASLEFLYYGISPATPVSGFYQSWTLGNFGSLLIMNLLNQPLFTWNPIGPTNVAQAIITGPVFCRGFFIAMPQEQIVAYGVSVEGVQDPMLIAWSDAGSYTVWTASASNQAGTYRLPRGSQIIGAIQGPQQALIWTDVGCWLMQYIGYPDVYGFFEIAQGCGLISQFAAAVVGSVVYWMGRSGFWVYSNGAVQPLPCEVWDTIFPTPIDRTNVVNIRAAANTAYNEMTWYYTSQASPNGQNDSYARINVLTGEWDYGLLNVLAWVDDNIFGNPFSAMVNPSNAAQSLIMQHEMTNNANGAALPWSYTTGFFAVTEGEDKVIIDFIMPDAKWKRFNESDSISETVSVTLYSQDFPDPAAGEGVATYGPYTVTSATGGIEVRVRGRYFSAQISGNDLNRWSRLGGYRFRYAIDGRN